MVMNAAGIMDYVQALFSFFISPLLGVVLMGMFWKRATTAGGFWGLLIGTLTSIVLFLWVHFYPWALRYVALSPGWCRSSSASSSASVLRMCPSHSRMRSPRSRPAA